MRSFNRAGSAWLMTLVVAAAAPAGAQVTFGQVDDFEDGTTQGWVVNLLGMGAPPPATIPVNVLGGPAGAADRYVRLTALGGGGPGSRLNAINVTRWAGDYLAAGIGAIRMDVQNFGPADLYLRLALEDVGPMGPTAIAFSASPVFVAAGGDWTSVVFPILPGSLIAPLGTIFDALTSTDAVRIYHSQTPGVPNPIFPIAPVNAQLGVDNITAIAAIPEPSTVVLLGSGTLALGALAARRRRNVMDDRI